MPAVKTTAMNNRLKPISRPRKRRINNRAVGRSSHVDPFRTSWRRIRFDDFFGDGSSRFLMEVDRMNMIILVETRSVSHRVQQIRGNCSPASMVTTRSPPTSDRMTTMPA